MKKTLISIAGFLVFTVAVGYLFRAQLWDMAKDKITADMFVSADTDSFDPGVALGTTFPAIKAVYQGQEISSVQPFVHDKGMIFVANRSANW